MDSRNRTPLLASLELLASECPSVDVLAYVVRTLLDSPARSDLIAMAEAWGVEPHDLGHTVSRAAEGLHKLERSRAGWREPRQVLISPPATLALLQPLRHNSAKQRLQAMRRMLGEVEREGRKQCSSG